VEIVISQRRLAAEGSDTSDADMHADRASRTSRASSFRGIRPTAAASVESAGMPKVGRSHVP
jgi:hypothetical protein